MMGTLFVGVQRRTLATLLAGAAVVSGCEGTREPDSRTAPDPVATSALPPPGARPIRVLLLTATLGFRHDSIPAARLAFDELAAATGEFTVSATETVADITAERLADVDVLVFGLTTGELPFSDAQKAAILDFVNRGGGFMGFHSATDTLYTWPEYGALIGAYFKEHPWTQVATVAVEDAAHPAVAGLPAFAINEEFYTFRENPRGRVHVLLSLEPASVGTAGDFPLAWTQTIGAGRMYYNALGHFSATWSDVRFRTQVGAAVKWAAAR